MSVCATCLMKGTTISCTTIGIGYTPDSNYAALFNGKVNIGDTTSTAKLNVKSTLVSTMNKSSLYRLKTAYSAIFSFNQLSFSLNLLSIGVS